MNDTQLSLSSIDAIAVTLGPGSYTGLRVGLSSAKGIAYALQKPLIGLSTLTLLANAATRHPWLKDKKDKATIFAMLDARKMEVFGAIYDTHLNTIVSEQALEIDSNYLTSLIAKHPTICIGSATPKAKKLVEDPAIIFVEQSYNILDCIQLAELAFKDKKFEDVAYTRPSYLKEFYFQK